jgi:hypothetical protein
MLALGVAVIVLHGMVTVVDEGFHRGRGLPRWERIGHPLGTLTIAGCLSWLLAVPRAEATAVTLPLYLVLAAGSTWFVVKDEVVHAQAPRCTAGERMAHAMLFVLHPAALAAFAYLWWIDASALLVGQLGVALAFMAYQAIYWNLGWNPWRTELGDAWVCDGPGDGEVLVDEVRAGPVRDLRPSAG